jgi:hypothetical protein
MRPSMTEAERQARFRAKLRALAEEPERLPSGNYRDACADCGQVIIGSTPDDVNAARCACPPTRYAYLVELVCSLCARPVATVHVRTPRTRLLLLRPLRCQACGGVAVQGETTRVCLPEPIPAPRPRRGRPPRRRQEAAA